MGDFSASLSRLDGSPVNAGSIRLEPEWYNWEEWGGPAECTLRVATDDRWGLLQLLGLKVVIKNSNGTPVWWGIIADAPLPGGALQRGVSLREMANRWRVAYTTSGPASTSGTTAWAEDADSVARFGAKEAQGSAAEVDAATAAVQRDSKLARYKVPQKTRLDAPDVIGAMGMWKALGWKFYANLAGVEAHERAGSSESQPLGLGLTATTIAFEDNNDAIHDIEARLGELKGGYQVRVSGSAANSGTHTITRATSREKVSYTATTIRFEASDDIWSDVANAFEFVDANDLIRVTGAGSNNGSYFVDGVEDGEHIMLDGSTVTAAAAGPSVTIERGHWVGTESVFTQELPGASITLTVTGQEIVQPLATPAISGWTAAKLMIKLRKVGTPADAVRIRLASYASGAPTTTLETVDIAAASIGEAAAWLTVTLSNLVAMSSGQCIRISRSGANDPANYYMVDLDGDGEYAGGSIRLYDGSAWVDPVEEASLLFRIEGATATTTQMGEIVAAVGQSFVTGVDIIDASGVTTLQYRDGDRTGLEELERLLEFGSASGERMLAMVTVDGILQIRKAPAAPDDAWLIDEQERLRTAQGNLVEEGLLPVGRWVKAVGAPRVESWVADLARDFVIRAAYDVADRAVTQMAPV
ncbi:MAG: hypothetical protein AB7V39_02230 [Nitrospiraceae bacterium]